MVALMAVWVYGVYVKQQVYAFSFLIFSSRKKLFVFQNKNKQFDYSV